MATTWRQDAFRISNDDGSETGASYQAALNTNGSRMVGQNFRLRFLVSEQGSTAGTLAPTLYYSLNGGTYTRVDAAASVARPSASSQLADGAATSRAGNSRAIGTGTFVAGSMDEVDGALATTGTIARYSETELEFCIQLRAADVASGNTVAFRVRNGTAVLATYSQTPTITAGVALTGTAAESAVKAAFAGSGAETFTATGALSDQHPVVSGAGAEIFTGAAAEAAAAPTLAGSATVEEDTGVTGTGAWSCEAPWISGAGAETFSGTAAISARVPGLAATGTERFTGTAALSCLQPALTASGAESLALQGGLAGRSPAVAGTGLEIATGTVNVAMRPAAPVGAAVETFSSTAAVSGLRPTLASNGTVLVGEPVIAAAMFTVPPCQFSAMGSILRPRRSYGRKRLFRRI